MTVTKNSMNISKNIFLQFTNIRVLSSLVYTFTNFVKIALTKTSLKRKISGIFQVQCKRLNVAYFSTVKHGLLTILSGIW